jgi:hypothetical protein
MDRKMELVFESTKKFEKDLDSFQVRDRTRIISKINLFCSGLAVGNASAFHSHAFRPMRIALSSGVQPTLYTIRISADIRVILTVDDDPIFDQTIITLLRAVRHKSLARAYRGVAESLYQSDIKSIESEEF